MALLQDTAKILKGLLRKSSGDELIIVPAAYLLNSDGLYRFAPNLASLTPTMAENIIKAALLQLEGQDLFALLKRPEAYTGICDYVLEDADTLSPFIKLKESELKFYGILKRPPQEPLKHMWAHFRASQTAGSSSMTPIDQTGPQDTRWVH